MFPSFYDALLVESYIADEASIAYERQRDRVARRTLERISRFTKRPLQSLLSCDTNQLYTAGAFREQFHPDPINFFKGRLTQDRQLGVKATLPLDDQKIEQALANPDERIGFYSTNHQRHLSIEVRISGRAWKGRYLPTRHLRKATGRVIKTLKDRPPNQAFRLPDGVRLVWLFESPIDSESLVHAIRPALDDIKVQRPDLRLEIVGTCKRPAFIPARRNMVHGVRLLPLQFPDQLPASSPATLLGSLPLRPTVVPKVSRPKIRSINKADKAKYRIIRKAVVSHFSSRRRDGVVRLFNYIWSEHANVKAGRSKVRRWVQKSYGPDCVALPSSTMKLIDDAYKSVLDKLEDLRVLMPVGKYSHGEECHDPHPTFFWLDKNADVEVHPRFWIMNRLSVNHSNKAIAQAAGVSTRTVANWKKRPYTMPSDVAVRLQAEFSVQKIPEGEGQ